MELKARNESALGGSSAAAKDQRCWEGGLRGSNRNRRKMVCDKWGGRTLTSWKQGGEQCSAKIKQ